LAFSAAVRKSSPQRTRSAHEGHKGIIFAAATRELIAENCALRAETGAILSPFFESAQSAVIRGDIS
jgi:hypothetical protein